MCYEFGEFVNALNLLVLTKEILLAPTNSKKQLIINKLKKFYKEQDLENDSNRFMIMFNAFKILSRYAEVPELVTSPTELKNILEAKVILNKENNENNGDKEGQSDSKLKETDRTYIYLSYGTSIVKDIMQQLFRKDMVSSMYFDGEQFIFDEKTLNERIRNRQNELWLRIIEYTKYTRSGLYKLIKNTVLFDDLGNYSGVIEKYRTLLNELISDGVDSNKLDRLYLDTLTKNFREQALNKIDAFNAWFMLRNFDKLIKTTFSKGLSIREGLTGYINARENKYLFGDTQHLSTQWRDESKDYDETKEFGDVNRNIIITRQLYDKEGRKRDGETLLFSHVTSIIPKIWDLYYDNNFSDLLVGKVLSDNEFLELKKKYKNIYGIDLNYDSLTIGDLIVNAGNDPLIYYPLLFEVLSSNKGLNLLKTNGFVDSELNIVKTLFITMFDPKSPNTREKSLCTVHNQYSPSQLNDSYYSYMTLMFSSLNRVILREYYESDDELIVRTLLDKSIDEARYDLENVITANLEYSDIIATYNNENDADELEIVIDGLPHLIFKKNKLYLYILLEDGWVELDLNNSLELVNKYSYLISEITTLDFNKDSNFRKFYDEWAKENSAQNPYGRIIQFVHSILYNLSTSLKIQGKKLSDIKKILSNLYKSDNLPKLNGDLSINLISKSDVPTLRILAELKWIMEGKMFNQVVRGADGSPISIAGLLMLSTDLKQLYKLKEQKPDSATRNFSFFNLFSGVDFVRDYKGKFVNKKALLFNHSEVLTSCLLDYYNGLSTYHNRGEIPTIGFLVSIISDKTRLIRCNIDPNKTVELEDGTKVAFANLTTELLRLLISKELGEFYQNVRNNINTRLSGINEILKNSIVDNLLFNTFDNLLPEETFLYSLGNIKLANSFNFITFNRVIDYNYNEYIQKLSTYNLNHNTNITPLSKKEFTKNFLHDIVLASNSKIELKDEIDFTIDNNGHLIENQLLYTQIYDDNFWDVKNTEMVNDFLYDNLSVLTINSLGENIKGTAFSELNKRNKEWIKSGRLAIAKLTLFDSNGNPYDKYITGKQDLFNLSSSRDIYKNMVYSPDNTINYRSSKSAIELALKFGIELINGIVPESVLDVNNPNFNIQLTIGALQDFLYTESLIQSTKGENVEEAKKYLLKDKKFLSDNNIDLENASDNQIIRYAAQLKVTKGEGKASVLSEKYKTQGIQLTINPEFVKFNAMDFFISLEFMLTSVGTHLNHPGPTDAAKWMQQVKRNVSLSATKHKMQINLLNALGSEATACVIEDPSEICYNIAGESGKVKFLDGSMYPGGCTSYYENWSLGDSRVGITKKEFGHSVHEQTGTGIIIKTAGFPMTNAGLRNSGVDYITEVGGKLLHFLPNLSTADAKYILNYKMMSRDAYDFMENPPYDRGTFGLNLINSFDGQRILSGEKVYLFDPSSGNYYSFEFFNEENKTSDITFDSNTGETTITYHQVDEEGNDLGNTFKIKTLLRSAYDVWRILGGEWSCSLMSLNNLTKLFPSEKSFELTAKIGNQIGEIRKNFIGKKLVSQTQVNQYLKKSMIDFAITAGAIKQGATNVNSEKALYDLHYGLTTFKFSLHDFGIQLDAEHVADNSTLSMMTQVVNSLGARGYTAKNSNRVYQALYDVAIENLGALEEGLKIGGDSNLFREQVAKLIVDAFMKTSNNDGEILILIAQQLEPIIRENRVTFDNIKDKVLIDHPSVFNKVIANITSALTKKCVRLKFPGLQCVLNPSHKFTRLYDGHLRSYYKGRMNDSLILKYPQGLKEVYGHQIIMGATYSFFDNKTGLLITKERITSPVRYKELMDLYEGRAIIRENILDGRDLAPSNVYFKVGKKSYCIWDLDVIQRLYKTLDKNEEKLLRQELQKQLDVLGGEEGTVTINVKGKTLEVVPTDVKFLAFECILPMIFKTLFGLEEGDDVLDILNDQFFFLRRAIERGYFSSAVDSNLFDIEINTGNGQNVYLLTDYQDSIPQELTLNSDIEKRIDSDGNWWILDDNGENRLRISNENDKIYIDDFGNEVIYTENPLFYINNIKGTITISDSVLNAKNKDGSDKDIEVLFKKLEQVDEKTGEVIENRRTSGLLASLRKGNDIKNDIIKGWQQRSELVSNILKDLNEGKTNLYVNPITFTDNRRNKLIQYYLEKHASFRKSLQSLVARIPAQSHLSFMAMKCVGFSDNVNNAMVSIMLLWLLGSDFDIDKASFLGYKFKDGIFVEWSPFMKLATAEDTEKMFKISEKLPFPTGNTSIIQEGNFPEWVIQDAQTLINNNKIQIPRTVQLMQILVKLFDFCYDNGVFNGCLPLVDAWNKHNLYFKLNKGLRTTDALINFISTNMYNISINPKNWILGQAPIDNLANEIKKLASHSPIAIKTKRYSPGNFISKIEMLRLTLTGKENTGIMASSLKVFEAISLYYYNILNYGNLTEQEKLLYEDLVTGRIKLIANAYTRRILDSSENPELVMQLNEALLEQNNAEDAFLVFSALLTLSTDNAKDPTLSKINANPEMIGLYNAGLMEGMKIEDLIDIILSPTGRILNDLQLGNIFSDIVGLANVQQAINYINNGPQELIIRFWNRFNFLKDGALKSILNKDIYSYKDFEEWITAEVNPEKENANEKTYWMINNRLRQIRNKAYSLKNAPKPTADGFIQYLDLLIEQLDKRLTEFESDAQILAKTYGTDNYNVDILTVLKDLSELSGTENVVKRLSSKYYNKEGNTLILFYNAYQNAIKEKAKIIRSRERVIELGDKLDFSKFNSQIDYFNEYLAQCEIGISNSSKSEINTIESFIRAMLEWNLIRYLVKQDINQDGSLNIEKLKFLSNINAELSLLQPMTKLNQGLLTVVADQVNFMNRFESIIINRLKYTKTKSNSILQELKQKNIELFGEENYRIDLNTFLHNSEYNNLVLEAYDSIKCIINPLRVVMNVPHYLGYLTVMNADYQKYVKASGKYKFLHKCSTEILPNLKLFGDKKIKALKRSQAFWDLNVGIEFLSRYSEKHPIIINEGKYYDESNELVDVPENGIPIDLKTEHGRASFKYWIERVVVPELKRKYKGINKFIEDIRLTKLKFISSNKNAIYCLNLPINMMPDKNSEEYIELMKYKNELVSLNYQDPKFGNIFNLFYIYNHIVYNNQTNGKSLTKLIEELDQEHFPIIKDYNSVLSSYTLSDKEFKFDIDEYIQFISDKISPYKGLDQMGYFFVPELGKYVFIQKIKRNTSNYNYDEDENTEEYDELSQIEDELYELNEESSGISTEERLRLLGYVIVNYFNKGSDYVQSLSGHNIENALVKNDDGTFILDTITNTITWKDNDGNEYTETIKEINKRMKCTDWYVVPQKISGSNMRGPLEKLDVEQTLERLRNEQQLRNCNGSM